MACQKLYKVELMAYAKAYLAYMLYYKVAISVLTAIIY